MLLLGEEIQRESLFGEEIQREKTEFIVSGPTMKVMKARGVVRLCNADCVLGY